MERWHHGTGFQAHDIFEEAIDDLDLVEGLTHLIEETTATGSPEALAMCRALAHLGPPEIKAPANRAANTLASAGVKDRPWVQLLGKAEFVEAYGYSDDEGAQQSIALEFRYNKSKHVLVVLIDHDLGGGIKDCFVSDDTTRMLAEMRIEALRNRLQLVFHSPENAALIVHSALAQRPCPVQPDQLEDLSIYLPLLRERVRTMPKPADRWCCRRRPSRPGNHRSPYAASVRLVGRRRTSSSAS